MALRDWKKQWDGWSPGIASLFSLGNFFWTQDDAGESSLHLPRSFRELSLFRSLLDVCRYCGGKSLRHSAECVESYFTNRYANIVSVWFVHRHPTSRRRNIYPALPFLLCRFSDVLIFPSSLYSRHFHFLFPFLFYSVFFLSKRAPLGELNILGT